MDTDCGLGKIVKIERPDPSPFTQSPRKRDPRLPDTPTIYELMDQYKTPDQARRVATVILAGGVFGRPMVGPPGIPAERLKILRSAYVTRSKILSSRWKPRKGITS